MELFLDVLGESLVDTAKMLPFLFLRSCKKTPPGYRNARPQSGICVFDQRNYSIFTAKASVVRSCASLVCCWSSSI